jgi:hypothetical protein
LQTGVIQKLIGGLLLLTILQFHKTRHDPPTFNNRCFQIRL